MSSTLRDPFWLNVGCGPHRAPEPWWNVDREFHAGLTEPDEVVGDGLPYEDASVDRMYIGHIMEHIPMHQVMAVVGEWVRVLKPGAEVGVVGPDVNRALEYFRTGRLTRDELWHRMEHGQTTSVEAWTLLYQNNRVSEHAMHHWNCIPERVMGILQAAGFENVVEQPIGSVAMYNWPLVSASEDQFAITCNKPA